MTLPERKRKKTIDPHDREDAKAYAARILAMRDYSAYEMRGKLRERGYAADVVEDVTSTLLSYGYVYETGDDTDALHRMASAYRSRKKNPRSAWAYKSLETYLCKKGFSPSSVRAYILRCISNDRDTDPS